MAKVYYVGDEATACGYRLAGAETRVPAPGEAPEVVRRAADDGADLILLSAALADEFDADALERAMIAVRPLLALVPDVYAGRAAPDEARKVRLALGIDS